MTAVQWKSWFCYKNMKYPGKSKVVSSGDTWITDPYMSFFLCRGMMDLRIRIWGLKENPSWCWECRGCGIWSQNRCPRNSPARNMPPPLHHPMVPFKSIKVHSKEKDTRPNKTSTRDVLWHSGVSDLPQQGVHNKQEALPSPCSRYPRTHQTMMICIYLSYTLLLTFLSKSLRKPQCSSYFTHQAGAKKSQWHTEMWTEFIYKLA